MLGPGHVHPSAAVERGHRRRLAGRRRRGGDAAERRVDDRPHARRVYGAHDHQHHVLRHEMLAIKRHERRARQLLDECPLAEKRPSVRMRRVADRVEAPEQKLLGVVLDEIHLLEDRLLLVLDLVRRKARVGREIREQLHTSRRCSTGTTKS